MAPHGDMTRKMFTVIARKVPEAWLCPKKRQAAYVISPTQMYVYFYQARYDFLHQFIQVCAVHVWSAW